MEWSGQKDFVSSHEESFVVDGAEAGVLKSHGPLSFLKVEIRQSFHLILFCTAILFRQNEMLIR